MDTNTRRRPLALLLSIAVACASAASVTHAGNSQNALQTATAQAASLDHPETLDALQPGQFLWQPERATRGPLVMVVSLPEQRMHVYRDGVRIGITTISSGKSGKETPTGNFEILQKKREHYSNLYNNAPMPFMQRLTWDGIALHAGALPGYPASNGCVRLPKAFAALLFEHTERGGRVVVADATSHGLAVVHPGERAPVDAYTGLETGIADAAYASVANGAAYGATPD
jgi:hypothetical protein